MLKTVLSDIFRQYHSPYVAMGNNPVNFNDPTGGITNEPPPNYPDLSEELYNEIMKMHYIALYQEAIGGSTGGGFFGAAISSGGGIGRSSSVYYKECSYSYNKTYIQYLFAEGVGLLGGWSNVQGTVNIYLGSDGKYYANVSATGYTPASIQGDVKFYGSVDVIVGGEIINSYTLQPYTGSSILPAGRMEVGQAVFALPNVNNDVYLRVNVGYSYTEGAGYVVPIPAQGHYTTQVGYMIDAWSY